MKINLYLFICLLGGFGIGLLNGINTQKKFIEPECELPPRMLCSPKVKPEPLNSEVEEMELYDYVQPMPRYYDPECETLSTGNEKKQCGEEKMLKFIYQNIKYPPIARETGMEGMVVIQFIINKEGKIESPKIIRSPASPLGEEALRVVKLMSDWVPGELNGKPVNVPFNLPIRFKIEQ